MDMLAKISRVFDNAGDYNVVKNRKTKRTTFTYVNIFTKIDQSVFDVK